MSEPAYRYIVIRAHPDLPDGFLPPEVEGRWYSLDNMPMMPDAYEQSDGAVAVAVARFERRDDGATARVYEVRP